MTLLEHVYAIRNILSRGPVAQDFRLSDRLIAHFLQVARARLIEQKIDRYLFISEQSYQDWCVDLELSDFHNCCSGPDLDCKILRSITTIPKFLNSRWGNHLKVMDLTGRVLPEIRLTQNRFSQYALSTPSEGWFVHNNYLFLVNTKHLTKVLLNGLFNNPEEIYNLNCPNTDTNCPDFMSQEFPIDSDLVDSMYKLTLDMMLLSYRQPIDMENNLKDVETVQALQ